MPIVDFTGKKKEISTEERQFINLDLNVEDL
jgi:hypothetical protein